MPSAQVDMAEKKDPEQVKQEKGKLLKIRSLATFHLDGRERI